MAVGHCSFHPLSFQALEFSRSVGPNQTDSFYLGWLPFKPSIVFSSVNSMYPATAKRTDTAQKSTPSHQIGKLLSSPLLGAKGSSSKNASLTEDDSSHVFPSQPGNEEPFTFGPAKSRSNGACK